MNGSVFFVAGTLAAALAATLHASPGVAQTPPEFPWGPPASAPYALSDTLIPVTTDQQVDRPLQLSGTSGFDVHAGATLRLQGDIAGHPGQGGGPSPLMKLGPGHLQLTGVHTARGNLGLLQGSLGLAHSQALGPLSALDQFAGTRLDLADGVRLGSPVQTHAALSPGQLPAHWGVAPFAPAFPEVRWRVTHGNATLLGLVTANTPVVKEGAGTLTLAGMGSNPDHTLTLRQGGLAVPGSWFGSVRTLPGTVLSGTGTLRDAVVAGALQPGLPASVGTLRFTQDVTLAPTAVTRLRIDARGMADQIRSNGTARLAGTLWVDPTPGTWTLQDRWTLVQATGGLQGQPLTTADGRFDQVASTLRYLDPVLTYTPTQVQLALRYNAQGLNTADASWRGTLFEDSRFVREAALAHAPGGRPWARTWVANTTRTGQQGLPGDERDGDGLQLGWSHAVGPDSHVAAFAGVQHTRFASRAGQLQPSHHYRDEAFHAGLAASRVMAGWQWQLGGAGSWHHARAERRADAGEAALHSRPRAQLTQLWFQTQAEDPVSLGDWGLRPLAQAAWLRLHRQATSEQGSSLAAVALPSQTDQRLQTFLGADLQRDWSSAYGSAMIRARLGVNSLWGGNTLTSSQAYRADPLQRFEASGLPWVRHTFRMDLGVDAPLHRHSRLGLAYTGELGGGRQQHGAWLNVTFILDGTP